MVCQNCGNKQELKNGQVKYCMNCGQKLIETSSNLLDLRTASKNATQPKHHTAYNPAQKLHSTRQQKNDAGQTSLHHGPAQKKQMRQEKAFSTARSQSVTKFGNMYSKPAEVREIDLNQDQARPKTMDPHKSYHLSKAEQKNQNIAAAMARHHSRYVAPATAVQAAEPAAKRKSRLKDAWQAFAYVFKTITRPSAKLAQVAAATAAVLVLTGYVTYLNLPNISFRVAASRAGIEAELPRYTPEDYRLDGKAIAYKPGLISVVFRSEENGTTLTITQNQTQLDSGSLLEQYVNAQDETPTTVQQNGLVIYLYNETNATWVNAGKQYTIEGNGLIEREQLLKIASSL